MELRVAAIRLRSLALFGFVAGVVNGTLLGLPLGYGVMQLSKLFRPGDGTEAGLLAFAAVVVALAVGGTVSAAVGGVLYNRFASGGIRLAAVDGEEATR